MNSKATQRAIFRWIHIVFAIPIIGYVYSPFKELPNYAPVVRFVAVPIIVLTGLRMWKAISFDDSFRRDRPNKTLQRTPDGRSRTLSIGFSRES
jgi:hypothetical protein